MPTGLRLVWVQKFYVLSIYAPSEFAFRTAQLEQLIVGSVAALSSFGTITSVNDDSLMLLAA